MPPLGALVEEEVLSSVSSGEVFVAALSGGADSTALVAALNNVSHKAHKGTKEIFSFRAVHVNHNIRTVEECRADEEAVIALCEKLAVPYTIRRIERGAIAEYASEKGCGIEAAARHFRRRELQDAAREAAVDAILVAHTQDDFLETILMAVLRGAGPQGLANFSRRRGERIFNHEPHKREKDTLTETSVASNQRHGERMRIIRPFLNITRADVISYLTSQGIPWREDSSNSDTRFLRNRIRHKLVPVLEKEFPGWRKGLLSLAETQARVADFLAAEAGKVSFKADEFFKASPIVREEALFLFINNLSQRHKGLIPRREVVRKFVDGAEKCCDLGGIKIENSGGEVKVSRSGSPSTYGSSMLIKSRKDCMLEIGGEAAFPVVVRSNGAYAELRDKEGRTWKIKTNR